MQPPSADAFIGSISKDQIAALAILYDRFAHALEPFSPETDRAERIFNQEIARLYDELGSRSITFHEFRKGIILRCKRQLSSTDKPASV